MDFYTPISSHSHAVSQFLFLSIPKFKCYSHCHGHSHWIIPIPRLESSHTLLISSADALALAGTPHDAVAPVRGFAV